MQTIRDADIVEWLGRMGAASAEQVSDRFGLCLTKAYGRLGSLRRDGLVRHYQLLHRFPGMYAATRTGLRWRGLGRLSVFPLSPSTFKHAWQATAVAVALEGAMPTWELLSEREIRALELTESRLVAAVRTAPPKSRRTPHRADLALVSPSGRTAAIEIELSEKGRTALEKICRGWAYARHVDHVYYLAADGPGRGVSRVVQKLGVSDRITVLALEDFASLAERELAREQESQRSAGGRRQLASERASWRELAAEQAPGSEPGTELPAGQTSGGGPAAQQVPAAVWRLLSDAEEEAHDVLGA